MAIHKLLARQLSSFGLNETTFSGDLNQWQSFINLISKVYSDFDNQKDLIESRMGLSPKEINKERAMRLQLERTQAITEQFLAHIKLSFYQMSTDGSKITFLNREIEIISGKPQTYFLGISQWLSLVVSDDREKVKQYYITQAESNISQSIEYKIEHQDGSVRNILDRCFVANNTTNKVVGLLGIIEDLTSINLKRRMESVFKNISHIFHKDYSLQNSADSMLKKICQSLEWPIGEVWLLDETKKLLYLFASYSNAPINSKRTNFEPIVTVPSNTGIFADILKKDSLTYIRDQHQLWHKNYPLCVAVRLEHNAEPLGVVNFFINEANDLMPEVHELLIHVLNEFSIYLQQQFVKDQYFLSSNYDAKTGLVNHSFMIKSLKELISTQSGQTIVAMKVLIDQIEKINQAYGADVSNTLLKELTAFFLKKPHPNLHLMSSLDDQGFVFLFNNLNDINEINSIVQLMLSVNKEDFFIGGNNIPITISIGVGIFPKDGINEIILLSSAKAAVLKAHKSGGNCAIYATETIKNEFFQQVNIEFALHRALTNKEFVLHYQPKVDFKTGTIIGAEALIRWQDPDGTLHMPDYFLEIAENTELIVPIGEWVLREVCRQIAEDNFGVPIAVNLSIRQFKTNNYFFDFVTSVIEEYAINPQMLEFEVTESIIISRHDIIKDFIKFRNMGIHIAFDDFGTKYCSLSYLKNYIPDRIKIDKSFVDGIPQSRTNIAIVKSIVELAKSLNILLTVEGAELPEQVKFFIDLGCNDLQSYFISKAVPAIEFKGLLRNNYKDLFDKLI